MVAKIIVNNTECQIIGEYNLDFLKKLDRELSFWVQGAEHSKAYKGYINSRGEQITWDGQEHLLSSKLKFPYGLLERVRNFYEKANLFYEINDLRPNYTITTPLNIFTKLTTLNKEPYQYQIDAARLVYSYDHGVFRLPTGSGKTLVAALMTAYLNKSTIIYVVGKDLLYQFHDLFSAIFEQKIGIIGDGKCEIADVNIVSVWTAGQALGLRKQHSEDDEEQKEKKPDPIKYIEIRTLLKNSKTHIFDECHLAASNTIQEISKIINPENIYGMSASPWRDDGAELLIEAVLGPKIIEINASSLIQQSYLVPAFIKFLTVPRYTLNGKYKTIYSNYIVNNDKRNEMVCRGAVKLVEQNYKTLVLFRTIEHGKILHNLISKQIPCALLSGKDSTKNRLKVKKQLENNEINCIIASTIFDQGIDIPSLSGLVLAGAGKSSVRALQRIGRVIRKHPKKENAAIIDFADQAPYLFDHSIRRKEVYLTEFPVQWPEEKI